MSTDFEQMKKAMLDTFGSREGHLGWQIIELSRSGQPCDITFFKRAPIINTKISERISTALMYGAGAAKLKELFESIEFGNGERAGFGEIWTINPMPAGGFTVEELAAIDMSEVDRPEQAYGGKSLRDVIKDTYRPTTDEQLDLYIRRWIAS
ncbi:hypothetical protein [Rhizobium sp. CF142]|uniref:hypothetical protein n=1 Tax=Rhizobium sp. CF142 TaxID=1144314 RepID=UPI00026EFF1A|nr:hypothetical protein [Rhizobium sp. CF142]EJJ28070.1 hypothetical protein PMI11_03674 [Rhizobium sp. CF142]